MGTTTAAAPTATAVAPVKRAPKQLPAPNSDFYQLADVLTAEEKAIVKKVRTYMETSVVPIINKYWSDDAFPFERYGVQYATLRFIRASSRARWWSSSSDSYVS